MPGWAYIYDLMRKNPTCDDCAVHNIETRENFDFVKNDPENTVLQGKNRVFLGIVSKLQFSTSFDIMNRTVRFCHACPRVIIQSAAGPAQI